jgi:hypothetical protein
LAPNKKREKSQNIPEQQHEKQKTREHFPGSASSFWRLKSCASRFIALEESLETPML